MLESKGLVSRRALSEAYRFFDLPEDGGAADDDRIYNIFQAQHDDLPAQHQERAREMLGRIGRRRGSKLLMNASQQTIETAQEAYAWLGNGLGPETDDSFVVTIFSLRVSPTHLLPGGECTSACPFRALGKSRSHPNNALTSFCRPRGTKT
jgi:ubiquitin carboxyl-terminal hydrolase 25/28